MFPIEITVSACKATEIEFTYRLTSIHERELQLLCEVVYAPEAGTIDPKPSKLHYTALILVRNCSNVVSLAYGARADCYTWYCLVR